MLDRIYPHGPMLTFSILDSEEGFWPDGSDPVQIQATYDKSETTVVTSAEVSSRDEDVRAVINSRNALSQIGEESENPFLRLDERIFFAGFVAGAKYLFDRMVVPGLDIDTIKEVMEKLEASQNNLL